MDGEVVTLCTYEIYVSVVISTLMAKQGSGLQLFQEDGSWELKTYRQVLSSMFYDIQSYEKDPRNGGSI